MRTGRRDRRCWIGALTLLLGAAAAGCNDDPTRVRPEQLEGIWNAVGLVAVNVADTSETEDIIALGGGMVVSIEPDNRITVSFSVPGFTDSESGTYALDGDEIAMVLDGDPVSGTFELDGNTLDLRLDEGIEWDFGDDGIDVPALLEMQFVRIS